MADRDLDNKRMMAEEDEREEWNRKCNKSWYENSDSEDAD